MISTKAATQLREIDKDDLGLINDLRKADVVQTLVSPFRFVSKSVDEAWMQSYQSTRANNVRLAIEEDGVALGVVYLLGIDWINRSAEFGMAISPAGQGRGLGFSAGTLAIEHAFSDLNLSRLHLTVLASHAKARSLYVKLGFVKEGEHPASTWKQGSWVDQESWALLRADRK